MVKFRIKISDEVYNMIKDYPNIDWNKVVLDVLLKKLRELKSE